MPHLLLALLLAPLLGLSAAAPAHPLHVSYGRMGVEGNVAMCQIRFFRHDLEAALQTYHRDPQLRLAVDPRADARYAAYFNDRFRLEADGRVLRGTVVASGEEDDMWWYTVRFDAAAPLRRLTITHTMLFETFDDQRNIMRVRHFPSEASQALYFSSGDETNTVAF